MGYLRGLTHGAIVGAVIGFLYAPDSGVNVRRRVARLLGEAQGMMAADGGTAPPPSPAPRRRPVGGTETRVKRSQA